MGRPLSQCALCRTLPQSGSKGPCTHGRGDSQGSNLSQTYSSLHLEESTSSSETDGEFSEGVEDEISEDVGLQAESDKEILERADLFAQLPFAQSESLSDLSRTLNNIEPNTSQPAWRLRVLRELKAYFSCFSPSTPPIPPGKTRVTWQCVCGAELHDDYTELRTGAARELESFLRRSSHSLRRNLQFSWKENIKRVGGLLKITLTTGQKLGIGRAAQAPGLVNTECATRTPAHSASDVSYLLICHSAAAGQEVLKLRQLDICDIDSDKKLFEFLSKEYSNIRKRWWSWISFWTLQNIKFARFELYENEFVDIRKPDEVPPPNRDHEYRHGPPNPPELQPPLGSNLLMHSFIHPEKIGCGKRRLRQIPRRLKERLSLAEDDQDNIGWGLQFVEGWNRKRLVAIVSTGIASLLIPIIFPALDHNIQKAAAISSFMLSLVTLRIAALNSS
ncbi:uncharacterized protein K444DRAFT_634131 [Hyaloscypha bicolor E]|uniref:Uncharacterized protein n=1 Tax=Hyaloscypha bicolor E TaxID=1095630 RepID=A0A2J6SWY5_9HELO|nr:uncharacterized protein K444DRAFT_634131 [Hyaloscypha bicolor E]PMD55295.1 hypothetical protein K444DRAFT_634131 [Hyaloscypha bicolor E]